MKTSARTIIAVATLSATTLLSACGSSSHDSKHNPAPTLSTSKQTQTPDQAKTAKERAEKQKLEEENHNKQQAKEGNSSSGANDGNNTNGSNSPGGASTSKHGSANQSSLNDYTSASQGGANAAAVHNGSDQSSIVSGAKSSQIPISVSIPSIGLHHSVSIGSGHASVLEPSPGVVEEFTGYGRVLPGQPGVALMIGHVTWNGPDVFYNLDKVSPGASIIVTYADGHSRSFTISSTKSINKDTETTDQSVWGKTSTPTLVLMSCDASSKMVGTHHVNNYVVIAQ